MLKLTLFQKTLKMVYHKSELYYIHMHSEIHKCLTQNHLT